LILEHLISWAAGMLPPLLGKIDRPRPHSKGSTDKYSVAFQAI